MNALSRRSQTEKKTARQKKEVNIDEFVQASFDLIHARVHSIRFVSDDENFSTRSRILDRFYSNESERIAQYLTTLVRSKNMSDKEFDSFRKKAVKFLIEDEHLFRRASKNISLRRVIDCSEQRKKILRKLHDETEHREREETNSLLTARY